MNLRRHRRQIYSLFPLTTREPHLDNRFFFACWSQRRDSNPRPTDYKSVALPTELRWRHFICLIKKSLLQTLQTQETLFLKQSPAHVNLNLERIYTLKDLNQVLLHRRGRKISFFLRRRLHSAIKRIGAQKSSSFFIVRGTAGTVYSRLPREIS